ncbi:calpain-B-like [Ylistrum balloti]|uniref:calpain-B-like n=1 Tax=Ylistrum balloti TaxID=509963 RepID=UPI002905A7AC|nr:calpain-B-like [Ylistrum balloti]XP_060081792.1 calpain-B-like [Ylistrum balloti]
MSVRGSTSRRNKEYHSLRSELLRANSLFVDPEFPPNNSSLTFNGHTPRNFVKVVWKRPTDIVRNPKLFVRGASRFDLDQGALGNCWFIAGAAVVATHGKLIERVVPNDQDFDVDYAGIFHFNFWWYGKWTEVVIDDYLPTDGFRLIYGRNREQQSEFWPSLLEKAYAKLRGCYEALVGGKLDVAIVDMTGGISERIDMTNKSDIPNDLYDVMWKCYKMNSMLGASMRLKDPANTTTREVELPNGLFRGHAYSITGLATVPYRGMNIQLVRLRNPWGHDEWKGDWSDGSDQMKSMSYEVRKQLHIVVRNDGEFWMSYHDVLLNFDEIQLCHLQPDALLEEISIDERQQAWQVVVYHDAWIKGVTAGGCGNKPYEDLYWRNPQFFVTLKDVDETDNSGKCTLIVSLLEKEQDNRNKVAMAFDIYRLKNPQRRPLDGETVSRNALHQEKSSGNYEFYRENTKRFQFSPGTYVVIPSTFYPNVESQFMLRFFTEKPSDSGVLDEESGPGTSTNHVPTDDPIKAIFKACTKEDGKMYARELKKFLRKLTALEHKEPIKFNTETCRCLVTLMDRNRSGALNYDEAIKAWKEIQGFRAVFKQSDADASGNVDTYELGKMFTKLGFPISRMVLTGIVRRYGGRDNTISLPDFIVILCKLTVMYSLYQEQSGGANTAKISMNEFLYFSMFC